MSGAALLIDWDNIRARMGEQGLLCHGGQVLGAGLVEHARRWAVAQDSVLERSVAVAPESSFDADLRRALAAEDVAVEVCSSYQQAADMRILTLALQLNLREGVDRFVLVSGDGGFMALSEELRERGCACAIWPFSDRDLAAELVRAPDLSFVKAMLDLRPCPPEQRDETHLLVIALQVLALRGHSCWHVGKAGERVCKLGLAGLSTQEELTRAWAGAELAGYFTHDEPARSSNNPDGDRRVRLEQPELRRLLATLDELMHELDKQTALGRGRVDAKRLLGSYSHPWLDGRSAYGSLDLLVAAGVLKADATGVTQALPDARLGFAGSLLRMAAAARSLSESPSAGAPTVTKSKLARRWVKHASGGRRLAAREATVLEAQGERMVRFARMQNLLYGAPGTGLELRKDHPVAIQAERGMEALVRLIGGYEAERVPRDTVLRDMAELSRDSGGWPVVGQTAHEHRAWLGLMAAEDHVQISSRGPGSRTVALKPSPFVGRVLTGLADPERDVAENVLTGS